MPLAVYNPTRTYVVTSVGTNHLVRGNEPLNLDGSFAYNDLNCRLKTLIGDKFDLTDFKLIDMSIIDNNPDSERGDLELEFAAFGVSGQDFDNAFPFPSSWPPFYQGIDIKKQWGETISGHKGSIIWYPTQGCSDLSNCKLVEPPQFNFCGQVDFVQDLMQTENSTVLYYHCEHGHDRTSALTAGYMMKYMKRSLKQVLNDSPPTGAKSFTHPWEPNYEQLVEYYYEVNKPLLT